jgi:molecular chaperone GrpE (heat shock protein)
VIAVEPVLALDATQDGMPGPQAIALEPDGTASPGEPAGEARKTAAVPSAESTVEPRVDAGVRVLSEMTERVLDQLTRMQSEQDEFSALERRHVGIIEKLHAENTSLRQGELAQALKPILLDLARLHDDVANLIAHSGEELRKAAVIPELIVDVLSRHGVIQIRPEVGELFDAKQHQATQVVPTTDASLDATVAAVRRAGFVTDGGYLVRPAQVDVHRYVPEEAPAEALPAASAQPAESVLPQNTPSADAASPTASEPAWNDN